MRQARQAFFISCFGYRPLLSCTFALRRMQKGPGSLPRSFSPALCKKGERSRFAAPGIPPPSVHFPVNKKRPCFPMHRTRKQGILTYFKVTPHK